MNFNEELRNECRLLHAFQKIKYKEIAEYLEIKSGSFTNWLNGYYDLSESKQSQLNDIISNLKE